MNTTSSIATTPGKKARRLLLGLFLGALLATPASAYIVILKNGSQITTQKKYEVRGDKVFLILQNGTTASYKASEIDFVKTDDVNRYGTLTNSQILDVKDRTAPPVAKQEDERSFGDLISNRNLALPDQAQKKAAVNPAENAKSGMTSAGFVNLSALPRKPLGEAELSSEIMAYLRGQGVDDIRIFQGSKPKRALVEIVASSEASVFKTMKDAANCMVQLEGRFPKKLEAIELFLTADGKVPAGQFTLTPDLANQLASGRIEPATFFVRYVEF